MTTYLDKEFEANRIEYKHHKIHEEFNNGDPRYYVQTRAQGSLYCRTLNEAMKLIDHMETKDETNARNNH